MQVKDNGIVYGGGAAEIACSLAVEEAADQVRLACSSSCHAIQTLQPCACLAACCCEQVAW